MSKRELGRVEVLARVRANNCGSWMQGVAAGELPAGEAAVEADREEGAAGLQHRSAGRSSNRAHEEKFRQRVLRRVREKYGGAVGERFGRR